MMLMKGKPEEALALLAEARQICDQHGQGPQHRVRAPARSLARWLLSLFLLLFPSSLARLFAPPTTTTNNKQQQQTTNNKQQQPQQQRNENQAATAAVLNNYGLVLQHLGQFEAAAEACVVVVVVAIVAIICHFGSPI